MIEGRDDRMVRVRRPWGGPPLGTVMQIDSKLRREQLLRGGFVEIAIPESAPRRRSRKSQEAEQ